MKKLIWTVLVAAVSATAASLAIRGLRVAWTRIMNEEPPAQPWWARKAVGAPLKKAVTTRVEPAAAG